MLWKIKYIMDEPNNIFYPKKIIEVDRVEDYLDKKGGFLGFNLCSLIVILLLIVLIYTNKNKIKKTYKRYLNIIN